MAHFRKLAGKAEDTGPVRVLPSISSPPIGLRAELCLQEDSVGPSRRGETVPRSRSVGYLMG
jgi:hypothetical protein